MSHQRAVIREAIVALLLNAGTLASTRVYDSPSDSRTTFPALVVESDDEAQEVASTLGGGLANRYIERTLRVVVSAEIQQVANYARTRDDLLAQVETALATSSIAGVKNITPAGFRSEPNFEGEKPIIVGRQHFDVVYMTTQGNPATTF